MAAGGAFANVLFNGKARLYDFFCQTPREKRPVSEVEFFPITVDFGDAKEEFHIARASLAVPGAIAGVFALHRDFGSIPMRELVQPAMEFTRTGFEIVPFQYLDFELLEPILRVSPISNDIYFNADGSISKTGGYQNVKTATSLNAAIAASTFNVIDPF